MPNFNNPDLIVRDVPAATAFFRDEGIVVDFYRPLPEPSPLG